MHGRGPIALPSTWQGSGVLARPAKVRLDGVSVRQGESRHPALILLMEGDHGASAGGLLSSSSPGQFLHVRTL